MRKATCLLLLVPMFSMVLLWTAGGEAGPLHRRKPPMPPVFHTEQQLVQYLRELDDYYLVLGKPRFGRSMPPDDDMLQLHRQFGSA